MDTAEGYRPVDGIDIQITNYPNVKDGSARALANFFGPHFHQFRKVYIRSVDLNDGESFWVHQGVLPALVNETDVIVFEPVPKVGDLITVFEQVTGEPPRLTKMLEPSRSGVDPWNYKGKHTRGRKEDR